MRSPSPLLALRQARQQLLETGQCPEGVVDARLARSWHRSVAAGLAPTARVAPEHASSHHLRHVLATNHALLAHSRPVMEYVFDQVRQSQSVVVLADSAGMLMHTLGDPYFVDKAERVALTSGASWAEAHRGTNAIGTALAQQHLRNVLAYLDVPTLGQPEAFIHAKDDLFTPDGGIGEGSKKFLQAWMDQYVAWVKKQWGGKLILKGIMDAEDAKLAVASGADAIVVSNHGGRQLDGAQSSIEALPAIVAAVGDQIEVWMDGGIRSGQDVLKAWALGARGVLIGRAMVYGLGAMGEEGVSKALQIIHKELDVTMAFCGHTNIQNVNTNILLPGTFPTA